MKLEFKKSFFKEIGKIKDKKLQNKIKECIAQVESAENLGQIKNLKKLKGYDIHYRIRLGNHRLGVKIENEIIYFAVFEDRKNIYKKFP